MELALGDSASDFHELLRYMYTGQCTLTAANALPLLRLSNYYEVTPLKEVRTEAVFCHLPPLPEHTTQSQCD